MFIFITGGAGSGKSQLAEKFCTCLKKGTLYYIATMQVYDEESKSRVEKHRKQRAGKGFITIECPYSLENIALNNSSSALLECISNLVANEMFFKQNKNTVNDIITGIKKVSSQLDNLVIVSNEIFDDGCFYDSSTLKYIENMGKINCVIASLADIVIEVVCGIPLIKKGGLLYNEIFT